MRIRRHVLLAAVAGWLALPAIAGAQPSEPEPPTDTGTPAPAADGTATADDGTPAGRDEAGAAASTDTAEREKDEPKPEDLAQGTCRTPREAWLQLLYWLQGRDERWEPKKAAACFAAPHLSPRERGERAVILKKVLDRKPTWLEPGDIPDAPDYTDPDGRHRYEDPIVERDYDDIILTRTEDGRWVFSPATIEIIPSLYPRLTAEIESVIPAWLMEPFLGIELWKYLAILALVFIAITLQKLVVFVMSTYGRLLVRKLRHDWMRSVVHRADRPIGGLAMATVFFIGVPMLLFPPRVSMILMLATKALAAYSLIWLGYRMIDVLTDVMEAKAELTESKLDDQLVPMVSKTLKVFVSVIGFIFILQNLDVDVGSLLAGLGLGGLAFALAAKDTIANFFGSFMIFIDKPFQIGDWVVMSGVEGIVEEVGFRTSRVRTFYNSQVTVPNALVTNAVVDNYGRREYRRYSTTLGLCYDTPPDKVQAFCEGVRAIIAGMPQMRKDYYLVEFSEFGPTSLNIMVYAFFEVTSFNDEMRGRSRLNLEVMRLAREIGVSFAFPTQTLHIDSMVQPGESKPSHSGPEDATALAGIIDAFAPGGGKSRPLGASISQGYDNSPKWAESPGTGKGSAEGES